MTLQQLMGSCVARSTSKPILRMGSTGPDVRDWQTLMQKEMGAQIQPDGIFGHSTLAATLAFQKKAGLNADGIVAQRSWAAAMVAPCYAQVLMAQRAAIARGQPMHGLGADLSFSMVDPKSMILGAVIGVAAGAVLFLRK